MPGRRKPPNRPPAFSASWASGPSRCISSLSWFGRARKLGEPIAFTIRSMFGAAGAHRRLRAMCVISSAAWTVRVICGIIACTGSSISAMKRLIRDRSLVQGLHRRLRFSTARNISSTPRLHLLDRADPAGDRRRQQVDHIGQSVMAVVGHGDRLGPLQRLAGLFDETPRVESPAAASAYGLERFAAAHQVAVAVRRRRSATPAGSTCAPAGGRRGRPRPRGEYGRSHPPSRSSAVCGAWRSGLSSTGHRARRHLRRSRRGWRASRHRSGRARGGPRSRSARSSACRRPGSSSSGRGSRSRSDAWPRRRPSRRCPW